ncbi:hypothetical protein GCM10010363_56140 [Streptomyces omiyaensis]|nr:hypothetical protein GCM10010363_56140 [Streptomyces omiyaensis]
MLDDVGTFCATTNATPETSFAPRHRVDAPATTTGNRLFRVGWSTSDDRVRAERAGAHPRNRPGRAREA